MKPIGNKSYVTSYPLGTALSNAGILKVVKSSNSSFKPGDVVLGNCAFSTYQIIPSSRLNISPYAGGFMLLDNPLDLDPKLFLGALGMSGLTAYSSFYEIGKPKKGETIFISAASGAVGQIVGQLAKREGLRVLGSVGSQEKLDFITKELGFDAGFNYKEEGVKEGLDRILEETGGGGLNMYVNTNIHALQFILRLTSRQIL
jgi:NADPH-dependent curcumin reductase CurA